MARGPFVDPEVRQMIAQWVAVGERSAAAIRRALEREINERYRDRMGKDRPHVPTERTIARLVRQLSPPGPDEPWSLARAEPQEAAAVLRVLPVVWSWWYQRVSTAQEAVLEATFKVLEEKARGQYRVISVDYDVAEALGVSVEVLRRPPKPPRITLGLARWIAKVVAAAPTLDPYYQFLVAREYLTAELEAQAASRSKYRPVIDTAALDLLLAYRPWESLDSAVQFELFILRGIIEPPIFRYFWWRELIKGGDDRGQGIDRKEG